MRYFGFIGCCLPKKLNRYLAHIRLDKNLQYNYHVIIRNIAFEWDANKASLNKKNHGISFDEARTVFFDENAAVIHDPEHSATEERFVILGLSATTRILIVCHCYRKKDSIIRIISARKATKKESMQYYGGDYEKRI